MTIEQKTRLAAEIIEASCRIYAPKDTGNLSMNAIRCVYENGIWQVVIGGEIAPYAVFTNEPWINRKGTNPNENWIQDAIESIQEIIVDIFSGRYTEQEIQDFINDFNVIALDSIQNLRKGMI